MKQALCVNLSALHQQDININEGIHLINFDFNLIPSNLFNYFPREVVDHPERLGLGMDNPQVLPYAVIKCGNLYATYSRKNGAEERLHGSRSIGFGGHIDPEDKPVNMEYQMAADVGLRRELIEELGLHNLKPFKFTKALIDYTNDVGKVHLGLPVIISIDDEELISETEETYDLQWMTKGELIADMDLYENWSKQLILEYI